MSGTLAAQVAEAAGARSIRTLTGFKWLVRAGEPLCFAYEEAIGYCVDPDAVRDKDGIGSAVLLAQIAARLRREGSSIASLLDDLALRHGSHVTVGRSLHATPGGITAAMNLFRSAPRRTLGGIDCAMSDYANRDDGLRTDMVEFIGADGDARVRALVRPSGTEPKAKAYVEAVVPVVSPDDDDLRAARTRASDLACAIANDLFGG